MDKVAAAAAPTCAGLRELALVAPGHAEHGVVEAAPVVLAHFPLDARVATVDPLSSGDVTGTVQSCKNQLRLSQGMKVVHPDVIYGKLQGENVQSSDLFIDD